MVWRRFFRYPAQAIVLALPLVCLLVAALLSAVAWRTHEQLSDLRAQARHTAHLQEAHGVVQHLLSEEIHQGVAPEPEVLGRLRSELTRVRSQRSELHEGASASLERLDQLLAAPRALEAGELEAASLLLQQVVTNELEAQKDLLQGLRSGVRVELGTAVFLILSLATLGLAGGWLVSRRVLRPLGDLRGMFLRLEGGEFSPIPVGGVHPLLVPLFQNYNQLVVRLEELERQHRCRAADLEGEVQTATETLLEQERSLARAERLATVGEMAAGLAHELRNPLAGVQLTLANLRDEVGHPGLAGRLDLARQELDRLTRLLNHQLSMARHVPEEPGPVDLHTLVEDLLALLRYQVPAHVHLEAHADPAVPCMFPRDRLRQALLNLVLNSVQAIGAAPGTVRIGVQRQGDWIEVTVTDDGPGFPVDLLKQGSRPFVTRRVGGTGLGLAMVRRLVRDLDGEFSLENLAAGGARVSLLLPCTDA